MNIPTEICQACATIGHPIADIPSYRIDPGRILLSVAEEDDAIDTLLRLLPPGASAAYTGSSDTDDDGETTVDLEITW
jgi:hypothetical protein